MPPAESIFDFSRLDKVLQSGAGPWPARDAQKSRCTGLGESSFDWEACRWRWAESFADFSTQYLDCFPLVLLPRPMVVTATQPVHHRLVAQQLQSGQHPPYLTLIYL